MTLLYLSLATMLGIALGRWSWDAGWLGCGFPPWLWVAPLFGLPLTPLLTPLLRRFSPAVDLRWPLWAGFRAPAARLSPPLLLALALAALCGAWRYAAQPLTPCWASSDLAFYNLAADLGRSKTVAQATLTGYVDNYPMVSDAEQELVVRVQTITLRSETHAVSGLVRLKTGMRQRYAYGQPVQVRGRLTTPPDLEDFSYREYLARKGIHSMLYSPKVKPVEGPLQGSSLLRMLYGVRARGEALINRALPEPYAALANGMLLGIEAGIPDELYDRFNATGSSHVIVISGSNVALLAGVLTALGQRLLGRRYAVFPALTGIAAYALLVGGDAAVLRAAVMGSLVVVAASLGRQSTALVSLGAACWLMLLVNPLTLWDVGFQLSSVATAGLILFSPGIGEFFKRLAPQWKGGLLTGTGSGLAELKGVGAIMSGILEDGLVATSAANVATMPLILFHFGRLSVVSLLTNLIIVPVQPLVMFSGTAALVIGVAGAAPLAQVIFWVTWVALAWTVTFVTLTSEIPYANVAVTGYGMASMVVTYLAIAAVRGRAALRSAWQRLTSWARVDLAQRVVAPGTASLCGVAALLVWLGVSALPDGRLHVYFLDIGQGDAIFIQTPSGRQVLIDGGREAQTLFAELGAVMPFWDRSIDLLVLTHPDADHMAAQIDVPGRFAVSEALDTRASQANPDGDAWRSSMTAGAVAVELQSQGGWVDLGDGAALWVLWPTTEPVQGDNADNENSLVLKLVYGDFSVLLTGDAGEVSEMGMITAQAPLRSTVLKAGHHGSSSSTSTVFLGAVQPMLTVIQVGKENDYGHPHQATLMRLGNRTLLRNDLHGRIHVVSDGRQMWSESEVEPAARP